jgi:hypothetical protein
MCTLISYHNVLCYNFCCTFSSAWNEIFYDVRRLAHRTFSRIPGRKCCHTLFVSMKSKYWNVVDITVRENTRHWQSKFISVVQTASGTPEELRACEQNQVVSSCQLCCRVRFNLTALVLRIRRKCYTCRLLVERFDAVLWYGLSRLVRSYCG